MQTGARTLSSTVRILETPISRAGFEEAIALCEDRVQAGAGGYVCFANVHTVTEAISLPDLRAALSDAFLAVADGVPLVWVSKAKGSPIGSRVCGPDFMAEFIRRNADIRHGFLGGAPGQAEDLARKFGVGAVTHSPPMRPFSRAAAREDWAAFLAKSGSEVPRVVWVGLGAPKQELWMNEVAKIAPGTLFFGVGAAFDFLCGTKKRAPLWMQKTGLEWFFRLTQEPKRLWKRYLVTNTRFLVSVLFDWTKT